MSKFYNIGSDQYVDKSPYVGSIDNIQSQIEDIIGKRHYHLEKLVDTRKRLDGVKNAINSFNATRMRTFGSIRDVEAFLGTDSYAKDRFWESLQKIDNEFLREIGEKCGEVSRSIRNAENRFTRPNISIAVVGESRQGKSTLIQKITGLDDDSVPTSEGDICTAARSRIINGPVQKATITFFTRDEFFHDVLGSYFVRAKVLHEDDRDTLNDFYHADSLYDSIMNDEPDVYIKRLEEYLDPVKRDSYEQYLGEDPKVITDFSELREYVAQRNETNVAFDSCKYLAVKDIEIVTPFAQASSASKLMIFDTIGVSEPTLDVKEQMYRTISEEADFVLYVSRLSTDSSNWIYADNVKLYYDMLKQLKSVPAYRWIFWVLNHDDPEKYSAGVGYLEGSFRENFNHIIDNIRAQRGEHVTDYMPAGVISVDCRDDESVAKELVGPLIHHLSENLGAIDEALIKHINQEMDDLELKLSNITHLS